MGSSGSAGTAGRTTSARAAALVGSWADLLVPEAISRANLADYPTGHVSPHHAGGFVEPRRTARTGCCRGRNRTRRYTPKHERTSGNRRTTTESATRGFALAVPPTAFGQTRLAGIRKRYCLDMMTLGVLIGGPQVAVGGPETASKAH